MSQLRGHPVLLDCLANQAYRYRVRYCNVRVEGGQLASICRLDHVEGA